MRVFSLIVALVLLAAPVVAQPRWQTLPLPPRLPDPTSQGNVMVDGARIYYAMYGNGEPVVLLHGGLGNSDHFGFQLPALVDKFQVIAIDSRGQGRSTRTRTAIRTTRFKRTHRVHTFSKMRSELCKCKSL